MVGGAREHIMNASFIGERDNLDLMIIIIAHQLYVRVGKIFQDDLIRVGKRVTGAKKL